MALVTYSEFDDAHDSCGPDYRVDGVLSAADDRTPVYFLVRKDADDRAARIASFEARYGKPMNEYQLWVLNEAEAMT